MTAFLIQEADSPRLTPTPRAGLVIGLRSTPVARPGKAPDLTRACQQPQLHPSPTSRSQLHQQSGIGALINLVDSRTTPREPFPAAKMAAMFSQNPVLNGPNYSFSDGAKTNNGELREHRFNP